MKLTMRYALVMSLAIFFCGPASAQAPEVEVINILPATSAPTLAASAGRFAGKMDLNYDFQAICFRELRDGVWMVGASKQLWHLQYLPKDIEVLHAGLYYASHLGGPGMTYGINAGVNIGGAGAAILRSVEGIAALVSEAPPWTKKLSTWMSLDFFGGYAPNPGVDLRAWSYGIGGKVNIPIGVLKDWSTGTPSADGISGKGL